ncbi:protein SUPPRESSOR OF GENE SILENCING 3 [Cajanus cajan]|uniref:Protein SGS3 n=1 Tax=Cajanus cajan TaxID=3821 RepID=A0A151T7U8_CAJCA|nr:protein SUPPRESSOR OF GENE SILENCING 3 [Cajanus cajan]XP_020221508.1 protein SUPPRESSOR OF GENE SILENCING 3 [Cajanus cajan]KYP63142.1 hypothetical protein KK1_017708 [Cajanus cajan]
MADNGADQFPELGSVYRVSGVKNSQLSRNVAKGKLNSQETGDSGVNSRHLESNSDGSALRPWYSQSSRPNVWEDQNVLQKLKLAKWGNGGSTVAESNNLLDKSNSPDVLNDSKLPPQSTMSPTLEKGLSVEVDTTTSKDCENDQCKDDTIPEPHCEDNNDEIADSESDIVFDSDDDCSLDDTDSDTGEKSHEGCKKSKWLRKFFDKLNALPHEEMTSLEKQWHCPACQGGPGAIDWYKGLQPLLDHSRTIQTRRARLHRMFAETLEEECLRRGSPLTKVCEAHDRWEGLDDKVKDHEIVWPPMVIITNTRFEQDENNKWNGMGNQELLDCFRSYAALKARNSYGPQGHRGMSVLIFDATTAGYLEAVRLHKHFKEQGRDREAWNGCKNPFLQGGKRQLYGYLASKEDLDIFNRHSGGKPSLKFQMRSYQEMVEGKIKRINEDSRKLDYFKSIIDKEQIKSQLSADSVCKLSEKLSPTNKENCVDQQKKEMDDGEEKHFQEQIEVIKQDIAAKEEKFVKLHEEMQDKVIEFACEESSKKEKVVEKISDFFKAQEKVIDQFKVERAEIRRIHFEKQLALKRKQRQQLLELEKEMKNELNQLMDKYIPRQFEERNGD